jgi:DNA-binding transcriptional MocR family regulator
MTCICETCVRRCIHCLRYTQAIAEYFPADVKVSRPQGGYVLWIELNKEIDAFELYKQAIAFKISISPGQIFSTDSRFTNFIRISFGIPFNDEIDKSLKILGSLMGIRNQESRSKKS